MTFQFEIKKKKKIYFTLSKKFINGLFSMIFFPSKIHLGQDVFCISDLILYKAIWIYSRSPHDCRSLRPLQRFCSVDNPLLKKQLSQSDLQGTKRRSTGRAHSYLSFTICVYIECKWCLLPKDIHKSKTYLVLCRFTWETSYWHKFGIWMDQILDGI